MTGDRVRGRLAEDGPLLASWHTFESPLAIELAGAIGCDLALIDQQHGIGGHTALLAQLTAARGASLPAVVRVASNEPGAIGRALDAGAQGIVCPMVNTAGQAHQLVAAAKYPPLGNRSWGPYRASLIVADDYLTIANDWTMAWAQIETEQAMDNLEEILATDGLDGVLVGPNDLALTLIGKRDITDDKVLHAIETIRESAARHGVMSWIFCNDAAYAETIAAQNWQIMTIGTDSGWMTKGAAAAITARDQARTTHKE